MSSKAILYCSAMHLAAINGNINVVEYLCDQSSQLNQDVVKQSIGFLMAAQNGHLDTIKFFLEKKEFASELPMDQNNTNSTISNSEGILIDDKMKLEEISRLFLIASKQGNLSLLMKLLDNGADINSTDSIGCTALHYGSTNGCKALVIHLLQHNADVNATNKANEKPIHFAARNGHPKIIDMLIKNGVDVNVSGKNLNTPLHCAVQHGSDYVIKQLINYGAKSVHNMFGYLPIYYSTNDNISAILMELGIDNEYKDVMGNTPLHVAAKNGHTKILKSLLIYHKNLIDDMNSDGNTALHIAAEHGQDKIIRILIKNNASTKVMNNNGHSVLHHSIENDQESTAMLLIELGCNIQDKTKRNSTVLHMAAQIGSVKLVRYFINSGLNVDGKNSMCYSPLIYASFEGHVEVAKILLDHHASVNQMDNQKSTALHYAVRNGNKDFVNILLDHGAKFKINNSGESPFYIASEHGFEEIRILLEKRRMLRRLQDTNLNFNI